jgi:CRP-like cAMP-binding protein
VIIAKAHGAGLSTMPLAQGSVAANQILNLLPHAAVEQLSPALECVELRRGQCLFEPGDDVAHVHFPLLSTVVALVVPMRDGRMVEVATIGREGAVGSVTLGHRPVFVRASVHISGSAIRIPRRALDELRLAIPRAHELLLRYADCLAAQVFQSAACAAVHSLEARCARALLLTHDRLQQPELPLTQEMLADMFGATRTYVTRIARRLHKRGAITYRRGVIRIVRREILEETVCECYGRVRRHFERVEPGLYPGTEL